MPNLVRIHSRSSNLFIYKESCVSEEQNRLTIELKDYMMAMVAALLHSRRSSPFWTIHERSNKPPCGTQSSPLWSWGGREGLHDRPDQNAATTTTMHSMWKRMPDILLRRTHILEPEEQCRAKRNLRCDISRGLRHRHNSVERLALKKQRPYEQTNFSKHQSSISGVLAAKFGWAKQKRQQRRWLQLRMVKFHLQIICFLIRCGPPAVVVVTFN